MEHVETIQATDEAWDSRELGADPTYAEAVRVDQHELDEALALQPISIRLQKSLIDDFKIIAGLHGLGYQTLMRQVLTRFVDCEKKNILREFASQMASRNEEAPADTPAPDTSPAHGGKRAA